MSTSALIDGRRVAAATVSGHRVLTPGADGRLDLADWTDSNPYEELWLGVQAALADAQLMVVTRGRHTEPSWSWTPRAALYLGASGMLTETVPTVGAGAAFLRQVAVAVTATSIFFDPQPPIALA